MALVNVVNMTVLDNPTSFCNPFQFEITFECLQELDDDLEWKVLYVSNAHDSHQDQILDEILVGPIPVGYNKFVLQADPPNIQLLLSSPETTKVEDILGVTVVLVTCSYKEREFVRIGYYVNNEYEGMVQVAAATDDTTSATTMNDGNEQPAQPQPQAQQQSTSSSTMNIDTDMDGTATTTTTTTAIDSPQLPQLPTSIYDIDFTKVTRHILADKPRVTKFPIAWNTNSITTTSSSSSTVVGTATTTTTTMHQQQQGMMMSTDNDTSMMMMMDDSGMSSMKQPQEQQQGTPSTVGTSYSSS